MKKSTLRNLAVVVFFIGWLILLFVSIKQMQTMKLREDVEIEELTADNDSLRQRLSVLEQLSQQAEVNHKAEVDSLVKTYDSRIKQIVRKYDVKRTEIKTLPLTDQVSLLGDFLWQTDSIPKIVQIGQDTTVQLQPDMVGYINEAYFDLGEYNEKYYVCRDYADTLLKKIEDGYVIMDMKDKEIEGYKQLDQQNKYLQQHLNDKIVAERKRNKRNLIKVGGLGVAVGSIIVLLVK